MGMTSSDWIQLAVAVATFLVVLAAIAQPWIVRLWSRTKLQVTVEPKTPDCVSCPVRFEQMAVPPIFVPALIVRARVQNAGGNLATDVEVYLERLERHSNAGDWTPVETFVPDNLRWSGTGATLRGQLLPGADRFVDLFKVLDPAQRPPGSIESPSNDSLLTKPVLSLAVAHPNFARSHLYGPGKYRLTISVSAQNAQLRRVFPIEIREPWSSDFETCLRTCVILDPNKPTGDPDDNASR